MSSRPYNVYRNNVFYRQCSTLAAAEDAVIRALKEGASSHVNYNGHWCADFKPKDLERPVWGNPDTFLARDIERGEAKVKNLPPALRGKNKRAVVDILRDVFGATEETAMKGLKELQAYLK